MNRWYEAAISITFTSISEHMKTTSILLAIVLATCLLNCGTAQQKAAAPQERYHLGNKTRDGIGKYYIGREIAHMMGPGGIEWLNRLERDKEENASLAIEKMNLAPNTVVADIGAGSGYYSFRIADIVTNGKVYAVEVQDEMINTLERQKKLLKKENVVVIKGDSINVSLPEKSVDLAFMVDVYHELEYPYEIIQSIKKALKPGGKILLIEYRGEDDSVPIKPLHKMTVAQVDKEMKDCGLKLHSKGDFLPIQHFLMYEVAD